MNALLRIILFIFALSSPALAQTAITLPIAANAIADLGNGPTKVRMIAGNASIFTSQGSGVGSTSGSSTALTLTATPATPPIVGGLISGNGITSGTTVIAYNGTTGITLSAAMTVVGGTTVSWGAACPSTPPSNVIQASPQAGYYVMYTQARVCAVSPGGPVNTLLIEPIFYELASSAVTSVATGAGLTGGPITSIGTISLAAVAADNLLLNATGGSAAPTGQAVGNCATALTYSTSGHAFGCNGALGTVTSVATNNGITGGTITTTGTIGLAAIAADSLLLNATGGSAVPTAQAVGSCSAAASALTYSTSGHAFGCQTDVARLALADQTISGGANVTSDNLGTVSSGTTTIDCGARPLQYFTNGGASTLAAPSNDGSCMVLMTNNGSAGAITFSGFTVGSSTGAALTTTNTNKFTISIWRINGTSGYSIFAHQ